MRTTPVSSVSPRFHRTVEELAFVGPELLQEVALIAGTARRWPGRFVRKPYRLLDKTRD
jgi:hypothetical protein